MVYFPYSHEKFEDEVFTKNVQSWDEILQRKSQPYLTTFKAMCMDEHVELIKQTIEVAIQE
jgi:hypothetical protein